MRLIEEKHRSTLAPNSTEYIYINGAPLSNHLFITNVDKLVRFKSHNGDKMFTVDWQLPACFS